MPISVDSKNDEHRKMLLCLQTFKINGINFHLLSSFYIIRYITRIKM